MSDAAAIPAGTPVKSTFAARFWRHPAVRIIMGAILTFAPLPLTMMIASKLVDKAYRVMWPQLLAALIVFLVYRTFIRRTEQRSLTEFSTQGAAREIGAGLLLGAGLVCGVFGVLNALGAWQLDGINTFDPRLLTPLSEMLLVGLAEEILFRGIVFRITEQAIGSRWAIVISALLFAVGHLPNEGVTLVAVISLLAYAVMQAAIYMRTRRLWLCIANHMAWNYCVGQIFATAVSGHETKAGLLRGHFSGPTYLTGGAFGVEGSIVTVVLIGAVGAYFLLSSSKNSSKPA